MTPASKSVATTTTTTTDFCLRAYLSSAREPEVNLSESRQGLPAELSKLSLSPTCHFAHHSSSFSRLLVCARKKKKRKKKGIKGHGMQR